MKALLAVILLFIATTAQAEVQIEAGPTYLSGSYSEGQNLILVDRITPEWEIGAIYITEQYCHCTWATDLRENMGFMLNRVWTYKKVEVGLGGSIWQNTNRAFGKKMNFSLMVTYNFNDRFAIRARHFSNAGSAAPNLGQDMFTNLVWKF